MDSASAPSPPGPHQNATADAKASSGQLHKTKLCRYFAAGGCKASKKCPYAHGTTEMKPLPDLRKTSICKDYQNGNCRYSEVDCRFAHGRKELRRAAKGSQDRQPPAGPSGQSVSPDQMTPKQAQSMLLQMLMQQSYMLTLQQQMYLSQMLPRAVARMQRWAAISNGAAASQTAQHSLPTPYGGYRHGMQIATPSSMVQTPSTAPTEADDTARCTPYEEGQSFGFQIETQDKSLDALNVQALNDALQYIEEENLQDRLHDTVTEANPNEPQGLLLMSLRRPSQEERDRALHGLDGDCEYDGYGGGVPEMDAPADFVYQ